MEPTSHLGDDDHDPTYDDHNADHDDHDPNHDEDDDDEDIMISSLEGKTGQYAAAWGDFSGCPRDLVRFNLFARRTCFNQPASLDALQPRWNFSSCYFTYIKGSPKVFHMKSSRGWPYMQGAGLV